MPLDGVSLPENHRLDEARERLRVEPRRSLVELLGAVRLRRVPLSAPGLDDGAQLRAHHRQGQVLGEAAPLDVLFHHHHAPVRFTLLTRSSGKGPMGTCDTTKKSADPFGTAAPSAFTCSAPKRQR